jgi:hypothetical protein
MIFFKHSSTDFLATINGSDIAYCPTRILEHPNYSVLVGSCTGFIEEDSPMAICFQNRHLFVASSHRLTLYDVNEPSQAKVL